MPTPAPALFGVPSSICREEWDALDAELARWLRLRASLRVSRAREASALDDVAMALRRVRAALAAPFASGDVAALPGEHDPGVRALVTRAYRWAIRIARELESIERSTLDPVLEWRRFEAFAPFALAFFDSALDAAFVDVEAAPDVAGLRRATDAVLACVTIAMTSSALAA